MIEAIIDIEIGNQMQKGTWDNKKADITMVGALLFDGDIIQSFIQIVRTKEMSKEQFAMEIKGLLNPLLKSDTKLWSLNAIFEKEAIEAYTGQSYPFLEVRKGLKGGLSSKESLYGFLLEKGLVGSISDPYEGNSTMAIGDYKNYLDSGNWYFLQRILAHNLNCLLKEFFILKNSSFILKNAQTDKNGYIERLGVG